MVAVGGGGAGEEAGGGGWRKGGVVGWGQNQWTGVGMMAGLGEGFGRRDSGMEEREERVGIFLSFHGHISI